MKGDHSLSPACATVRSREAGIGVRQPGRFDAYCPDCGCIVAKDARDRLARHWPPRGRFRSGYGSPNGARGPSCLGSGKKAEAR